MELTCAHIQAAPQTPRRGASRAYYNESQFVKGNQSPPLGWQLEEPVDVVNQPVARVGSGSYDEKDNIMNYKEMGETEGML
jgi:hypothetical protein